MAKKDIPHLNVQISSPENVLWIGRAEAVSSQNSQGPFDVQPLHKNFITIIQDQPIIIHSEKEKKVFNFKSAIFYVHDNKVQIYANV